MDGIVSARVAEVERLRRLPHCVGADREVAARRAVCRASRLPCVRDRKSGNFGF